MSKVKKVPLGIGYWLIQLTWGALMTIPGLIITGFCIAFLHGKPHKNGFSYIVEIGGNWGGLELGAVALCGNYSESNPSWFEHTRFHEGGHGFQNLWWGFLFPFVIGIPSAIRYWYQRLTPGPHADYDSIWFEGQASAIGTKWISKIEQ